MSSIGTGYDLAASTFSPDGRIFQLEYAQKALDNSCNVIALTCKDGVVLACDKMVVSNLYVKVSLTWGQLFTYLDRSLFVEL